MAEKFQQLKMNNAKASCMRDGVGAPDRIGVSDDHDFGAITGVRDPYLTQMEIGESPLSD